MVFKHQLSPCPQFLVHLRFTAATCVGIRVSVSRPSDGPLSSAGTTCSLVTPAEWPALACDHPGLERALKTPSHCRQDQRLSNTTGHSQFTDSIEGWAKGRHGCPSSFVYKGFPLCTKELGTFRRIGSLRQPTQLTAKSHRRLAGWMTCCCLSERLAMPVRTSRTQHQRIHCVPETVFFILRPPVRRGKGKRQKQYGVATKLANVGWANASENWGTGTLWGHPKGGCQGGRKAGTHSTSS